MLISFLFWRGNGHYEIIFNIYFSVNIKMDIEKANLNKIRAISKENI